MSEDTSASKKLTGQGQPAVDWLPLTQWILENQLQRKLDIALIVDLCRADDAEICADGQVRGAKPRRVGDIESFAAQLQRDAFPDQRTFPLFAVSLKQLRREIIQVLPPVNPCMSAARNIKFVPDAALIQQLMQVP